MRALLWNDTSIQPARGSNPVHCLLLVLITVATIAGRVGPDAFSGSSAVNGHGSKNGERSRGKRRTRKNGLHTRRLL